MATQRTANKAPLLKGKTRKETEDFLYIKIKDWIITHL